MSNDYFVPFEPFAEAEFIEKKSRFIGRMWRVESEAEAQKIIEETKKKYWDATHNCSAWSLLGGQTRCSDDGEPSGTAGRPMLEVLTREGVTNCLCIVTRYFGGILLGAGGLIRAYAHGAKIAIDAAGVAAMKSTSVYRTRFDYALFERMKLEVEAAGGGVDAVDYSDAVEMEYWIPGGAEEEFTRRVVELSAGRVEPTPVGERRRAVRIK